MISAIDKSNTTVVVKMTIPYGTKLIFTNEKQDIRN